MKESRQIGPGNDHESGGKSPHSKLAVGTGEKRRKGYLQINNEGAGISYARKTVCYIAKLEQRQHLLL